MLLSYFTAVPDVAPLSDPNVAVVFKSLLKKNSVTKEKNLNDLIKALADGTVDVHDTLIVMCWVQLYPKLALDNSRSVRILAHLVQATFLKVMGGKEFSKYLKCSIPIWLQALYDTDKPVANSSYKDLLLSFQDDKEKVERIWVVFSEQIVNYIHSVVCIENHETISDQRYVKEADSLAKYDRALNGAVLMLAKFIDMSNRSLFLSSESMVKIDEVLDLDKLWDGLQNCVGGETINTTLFKTYLILLKGIFALDNGIPRPFTKQLGDVKGLYKQVSKKFIKLVKIKVSGTSTSTVVYSNIILQFWDTLSALTGFTLLNEADKKAMKIKKNFWVMGGSKANSRLKEYLKLGPCLSDPLYFLILKSFFEVMSKVNLDSEDEFLSFESSKDAHNIIAKILAPQFPRLQGFGYKKTLAECLYSLAGLFAKSKDMVDIIFYTVLDGISAVPRRNDASLKTDIIESLAKFAANFEINFSEINIHLSTTLGTDKALQLDDYTFEKSLSSVCETYFAVLSASGDPGIELQEDLLDRLLEALDCLFEPAEITSAFTVILSCIQSSLLLSLAFKDWAPQLPTFVTKEFVALPFQILEMLLKKGTKDSIDYKELIGDFYAKLAEESKSSLPELFVLINKYDILDGASIEDSLPEAHTYLVNLSKKLNRTALEDQVVYQYLGDPTISVNLVLSATSEASRLKFILSFGAKGEPALISPETEASFLEIAFVAVQTIKSALSSHFLLLLGNEDLVKKAVYKFLTFSSRKSDFRALSEFVSENPQMFPLSEIRTLIDGALESIDLSVVALANPLAQNIHLVEFTESSSELNQQLLSVSAFFDDLLSFSCSNEALTLSGVCAEFLQDFNFLTNAGQVEDDITDLRTTLLSSVLKKFHYKTDHLIACINGILVNDDAKIDIFETLASEISGTGPFTPRQFYVARILTNLFTRDFEDLSLVSFDALEIQYTKLTNHPLKLAVVLTAASKFIGESRKLDKIRNFVFGEILGVRLSLQILTAGKLWVTLAINFLKSDIPYEIMPKHKLGMLVNHISGWLESDIAYDSSFIPMRSLLAVFFSSLIPLSHRDLPEKIWEVAVDLCLNNFSTAQVESNALELRYFTMRLFVVLSSYVDDNLYSLWTESKNSILEELVDLLVNKDIEKQNSLANNQPVILSNELMERILRKVKIPKAIIADNSEKFYNLLLTSKFSNLQRIATAFLQSYILDTQQDNVVEYQLRKSSLGDGSTENEVAELHGSLVSTVSDFSSDLEHLLEDQDFPDVDKYLWSWLLIFSHFKDITFSMRADYINQLKSNGTIEKLLGSIFGVVDITNNNFLRKLVTEVVADKNARIDPEHNLILTYNISEGCIGESFTHEMHFLCVHLYFLTFQYLGSYVQQWFNEIRDLQLKQQIEKFSVRYVSPLLISKMLVDVDAVKSRLTDKDENLSIKVNKITNEIKSVYLIDEQTMEMVVKIPDTFPLSNVSVQGPLRLGVKENQWKAWLLASQRVVSLTNGSIIDCIELFNKNVNLHFSGFEECAICYSILHQDRSLPSKVCPTCLNKFHAECLYKWFKSSGSSSCPLCRSPFNFKASRS